MEDNSKSLRAKSLHSNSYISTV